MWRVHKYIEICSILLRWIFLFSFSLPLRIRFGEFFEMRLSRQGTLPVDTSYSFDSCVEIFMECFVLLGWLISFIPFCYLLFMIWVLHCACTRQKCVVSGCVCVLYVFLFGLICCWFSTLTPEHAHTCKQFALAFGIKSWEMFGILAIGRWHNLSVRNVT